MRDGFCQSWLKWCRPRRKERVLQNVAEDLEISTLENDSRYDNVIHREVFNPHGQKDSPVLMSIKKIIVDKRENQVFSLMAATDGDSESYFKFKIDQLEIGNKQRKVVRVVDVSDAILYD